MHTRNWIMNSSYCPRRQSNVAPTLFSVPEVKLPVKSGGFSPRTDLKNGKCKLRNIFTSFSLMILAYFMISGESNARDCFGSLRAPLENGHYTGGLDCRSIKIRIKNSGKVVSPIVIFHIYTLKYETKANPGGYSHGGERLIILDGKYRYIGYYHLSTTPFRVIRTINRRVVYGMGTRLGEYIDFKKGVPEKVYFSMDLLNLTI